MSYFIRPDRSGGGWFRDIDGRLTTTKLEDESRSYTFDFTDALDSGETISTATWTLDGPVNDASSNTTTAATIRVSKTGTGELTVVTSASRKLIEQFRWRGIDNEADDYA